MTLFIPATYPGRPPSAPALVYRGRVWPVRVDGDTRRPVSVAASDRDACAAAVLDPGAARWSLAYGANADPRRLIDKGLDRRGSVLLPARLNGWQRVWEARRSPVTGAVPLTLQPEPSARLDAWVLGVHADETSRLDASEGRGERYVLAAVGPVAVAARFLLPAALAYAAGPAGRVLLTGDRPATYPESDQAAAGRLLAGDDTAAAVRPHAAHHTAGDDSGPPRRCGAEDGAVGRRPGWAGREVRGEWPPTTLVDLPLFTYGTLQPGRRLHPVIARFAASQAPARARGTLIATPHGWPAATFDDDGPPIHGTVVAPRDPAAARELVAAADEAEGVPDLFRRVAVEVSVRAQTCWAMAYAWNVEQGPAPGDVVADGRF